MAGLPPAGLKPRRAGRNAPKGASDGGTIADESNPNLKVSTHMYCSDPDCRTYNDFITEGDDKWCAECGADAPLSNDEIIAKAAAKFPQTFGLRAFPGDTFRISKACSYLGTWQDASTLMLYTERLCEDGQWHAFAKGTPAELRRNIVRR